MSEAGAGGRAVLWSLGLQTFPLPPTRLKETTDSVSHADSPSADCSGVSAALQVNTFLKTSFSQKLSQ